MDLNTSLLKENSTESYEPERKRKKPNSSARFGVKSFLDELMNSVQEEIPSVVTVESALNQVTIDSVKQQYKIYNNKEQKGCVKVLLEKSKEIHTYLVSDTPDASKHAIFWCQ